MHKKLYTLAVVLLITLQLVAQAPQKMSYQAVIRNSSNALVTATPVGMQISILQGSASGTAVYVETQTPTTNANGLVSIEIGGGTAVTGTFASINWAIGSYFIKTETDPTGGTAYTITSTSQLLSVPYALYAIKSGQQGKSTIVLANDITDAQAATKIAQEYGPNTENIIIQNTTQLTTVDLSTITSLINVTISQNTALANVNFNALTNVYGRAILNSNPSMTSISFPNLVSLNYLSIAINDNLTSVTFPSLTSSGFFQIQGNTNLTTLSVPVLAHVTSVSDDGTGSYGFSIYSNINLTTIALPSLADVGSGFNQFSGNHLSSACINSIIHQLLTVAPPNSKVFYLQSQNPLAPPTGQGLIDKDILNNSGNFIQTD